jgi:perosamine synthetase
VALSVAAAALELRPGDEILVPAYGVISTINAFAVAGLSPRLVDIDRRTGSISPKAVAERLTRDTKAVCYVNFSGTTGDDLSAIAALCAERGIPLIEDAAAAIGHRYRERGAGSFGTIGTLSFSVPKTLTTGQGGAIFTSSAQLADNALKYIDHGDLEWRRTNLNREIGTNLRFNDILAAVGLAQLATLDERLARKRAAYEALHEELGDRLYEVPGDQAPFYYIVFADDATAVVEALRSERIMAQRHGRALYEHTPYRHLAEQAFANAQYWSDHAVYLPFGLALSTDDARRIGRTTRKLRARLLQR